VQDNSQVRSFIFQLSPPLRSLGETSATKLILDKISLRRSSQLIRTATEEQLLSKTIFGNTLFLWSPLDIPLSARNFTTNLFNLPKS